jgi:cobalt-zinc-cadmium efflux system protein
MAHDHAHHHHDHAPRNFSTAFAIGVFLNFGFVVVEAVFGYFAHSLALLADAGHNLSDVAGLVLAWVAISLAKRKPSARHTYGLRRSSILAALANAIILLIAIGAIAWEAIGRFSKPEAVAGGTVMIVSALGIVVNTITALLFMSGRKKDINVEGAFLHMAADAAVSLGVLIAGGIIRYTGWSWLDPVTSLVIAIVIAIGTWSLFKRSMNLAMDAVPEGIDPVAVREFLAALPGVASLHDLHIWGMSTTEAALTVHLVRPDADDNDHFLHSICKELHDHFEIEHATIQIERGRAGVDCRLESDDVV